MIGNGRRLDIEKSDLIILLENTDPTKPPLLPSLSETTRDRVKELSKLGFRLESSLSNKKYFYLTIQHV